MKTPPPGAEKRIGKMTFFKNCKLNPNARLIMSVICGYRVEGVENPLIQKGKYLDKLFDELAREG